MESTEGLKTFNDDEEEHTQSESQLITQPDTQPESMTRKRKDSDEDISLPPKKKLFWSE